MAQANRLSNKHERALTLYKSFQSFDPDSPYRDEVTRRISELQKIVDEQKAATAKREEEERHKREELDRQKELDRNRELARQEAETKAKLALMPKDTPKKHMRLDLVGFAVTGVGVAALGAGIAMALLAKGASDDLTAAAKTTTATFDQSLKDKESQGKAFNAAGIGLLAVGGVCVAGGVAAIVVGLKWRKIDKQNGLATVAPFWTAGGGGVVMGGRF